MTVAFKSSLKRDRGSERRNVNVQSSYGPKKMHPCKSRAAQRRQTSTSVTEALFTCGCYRQWAPLNLAVKLRRAHRHVCRRWCLFGYLPECFIDQPVVSVLVSKLICQCVINGSL